MISIEQVQTLFDKYLDLVRLETEVFGVKPTEVRHLIGRLGEFYCAIEVKGSLSRTANQPGFDVLASDGRRISVKATAQSTGFVPIGRSTLDRADDLMIVQYRQGQLTTVYYGPIARAVEVSRFYEHVNRHELDIAKARRLMVPATLPEPSI